MQRWSTVKKDVGPLLNSFAGSQYGEADVLYPFWVLQRDSLWEVEGASGLSLTSSGRRPKKSSLDSVDPSAGLPSHDYLLLSNDPEAAAWVISTVLVQFFTPIPPGLLGSFGLGDFMEGRVDTSMRPVVGEVRKNRSAISEIYGGNNTRGITPLADGILTVFSDENGPYADGRIPETNWIAYTGDGLSGDQRLVSGNRSMDLYHKQRRALRYWHKLNDGQWSFETWAVIVQRRRRWGVGQDKNPRREFVWVLAPVSSPIPETWPQEINDALNEDAGLEHDDSIDIVPESVEEIQEKKKPSSRDKYKRLSEAAHRTASGRARKTKLTKVERHLRSGAAREAVILRSAGQCENPSCLGHSRELTDAGAPILEVDHVRDLGRGGEDTPENMIALCPNCHALKTRGSNRSNLRKELLATARKCHQSFLSSEE
jgi:5-methylcytosine-specific restriction protein A